jgi:hypothetical protein
MACGPDVPGIALARAALMRAPGRGSLCGLRCAPLVFVEQRHDLPHHDVHRIVTHLLRDRGEPSAVLGELADVELQLEVIAEEAREAVDDGDIEWRGSARARLDPSLGLGASVVRGGSA